MSRFTHKVVVVTGAGSGIGAATATQFAREGAQVVLIGKNPEKLERVAARLEGGKHLIVAADIADADAVDAAAGRIREEMDSVDILINCAGIVVPGLAHELSITDWQRQMATNVDGVFYMLHSLLPDILASQGNVVNVSSVSGLGGDWGMSFYNASKGAITNFTRALAMDYARDGVRINAVCPGFTQTAMAEDVLNNPELLEKFRQRIPLGRGGEPEEIAAAITFLASDDARYITGVNLPVDGGLTASNGQPRQA